MRTVNLKTYVKNHGFILKKKIKKKIITNTAPIYILLGKNVFPAEHSTGTCRSIDASEVR